VATSAAVSFPSPQPNVFRTNLQSPEIHDPSQEDELPSRYGAAAGVEQELAKYLRRLPVDSDIRLSLLAAESSVARMGNKVVL